MGVHGGIQVGLSRGRQRAGWPLGAGRHGRRALCWWLQRSASATASVQAPRGRVACVAVAAQKRGSATRCERCRPRRGRTDRSVAARSRGRRRPSVRLPAGCGSVRARWWMAWVALGSPGCDGVADAGHPKRPRWVRGGGGGDLVEDPDEFQHLGRQPVRLSARVATGRGMAPGFDPSPDGPAVALPEAGDVADPPHGRWVGSGCAMSMRMPFRTNRRGCRPRQPPLHRMCVTAV